MELLVLDRSILIKNHFFIFKLLFASNYTLFFPNIFSAFSFYFFLFWLDTVFNHIAHISTTTFFNNSIIY